MNFTPKIHKFLLEHKDACIELLTALRIKNPINKIKPFLEFDEFEILDSSPYEILSIRKKSTGEIFEKGMTVYSLEHDCYVKNIWFNHFLIGDYGLNKYYRNYVTSNTGIYPLSKLSLNKPNNLN